MSAAIHPLLGRQLRRVGLDAAAIDALPKPVRDLLERISRSYADHDRESYLLQHSQDVCNREMAQLNADLSASRARLESLVSLSSDWVWEQDADLNFTYISAPVERVGLCLNDVLGTGRRIDDLPPVPGSDPADYLARIAARQPFRDFVYGYRLPNGEVAYLRISGEPIFDCGEFVGYRGVASDVTQATLAEQSAARLARFDCLTGLANRGAFLAELQTRIGRARQRQHGLALLFIDLDRFKTINDTLGHAAGDDLLRTMAERLPRVLRQDDLLARLGGDEFVVLAEDGGDGDGLPALAERLLSQLRRPATVAGTVVHVSASIGIARFPDHGHDAATLLKNADAAMYLAKDEGKNGYRFFAPELAHRACARFAMESQLRDALDLGEFRLHFQPLFDLATGVCTGVEALLRWQHPSHGLLLPGAFLSAAEEGGLLPRIGAWTLDAVCRQMRMWQAAGVAVPKCAVNLGLQQIADPNLADRIAAILEATGLAPDALELEITESHLMEDPERARAQLRRLRAMQVRLAIDDFGTGYSSLAQLKRFRVDTLKIDRSFVRDLPGDVESAAIVQAVAALGRSLGMVVVAEGVENQRQLRAMAELGCQQGQGFLLGRPMSAGRLSAYLHARRHASPVEFG